MTIKAMKQALEALELCDGAETADGVVIYTNQEITALRQAIEQAEKQEPVAWQDTQKTWVDVPLKNVLKADYERGVIDGMQKQMQSSVDKAVNAMSKREWVGLTDEEVEQGYETIGHYQTLRPQDRCAVFALARAIEAKLKEKNT